MNGAHDMGGAHGFGPVVAEADEPVFHADWERRVLGLVVALGACGKWNIDMSRFARENRPPAEYLSLSYYEIWLAGLEQLLDDSGLLEEAQADVRVFSAADARAALARGFPSDRPEPQPPRFAVGDLVRTLNIHPQGHTRLPRYARGHVGEIERIHGCHVFPDHDAYGDEDPQWLYTVRFAGDGAVGAGRRSAQRRVVRRVRAVP